MALNEVRQRVFAIRMAEVAVALRNNEALEGGSRMRAQRAESGEKLFGFC